ncbi:hypothetical protein H5410_056171 [Solanum commersonii]|uniref:Uncharacterized protein n=1 Tax=Solanum commersonii TaxID=4109 RepID=A0A9J5WKX3_SOLCO|nr:hypothetical protein H5410_056171 [Solanum commersonii]
MDHKLMVSRKERRIKARYLVLTLIELLDIKVKINLTCFIIRHMQQILVHNKNGHDPPYGF